MFYIESENYIYLTRGDTAYLSIDIKNTVLNEEYVMKENDVITMSVKKDIRDDNYSFQKVIRGKNIIKITPEDTENLEYGTYRYDIQLNTEDGDVFTVIGPSKFKILQEVTA